MPRRNPLSCRKSAGAATWLRHITGDRTGTKALLARRICEATQRTGFNRLRNTEIEQADCDINSRDTATDIAMNDVSASAPLPHVKIFTDGACRGNPGPGGWACILRHPSSGKEIELSGGDRQTTNNRMELQAVIEGLARLTRRSRVEIVTDSKYVAQGAESWVKGWKKNGWRRKVGKQFKPVLNVELWQRLDELLAQHAVSFTVVKGHSGHPENERCDELAVEAAEAAR